MSGKDLTKDGEINIKLMNTERTHISAKYWHINDTIKSTIVKELVTKHAKKQPTHTLFNAASHDLVPPIPAPN